MGGANPYKMSKVSKIFPELKNGQPPKNFDNFGDPWPPGANLRPQNASATVARARRPVPTTAFGAFGGRIRDLGDFLGVVWGSKNRRFSKSFDFFHFHPGGRN